MEINGMAIIFLVLSITLTILVVYLGILLFVRKRKGNTLNTYLVELDNKIRDQTDKLKKIQAEFAETEIKLKSLVDLENNEQQLRENYSTLTNKCKELANEINVMEIERDEISAKLHGIKEDISIFEPKASLINLGFFEEPKYLFETSERFKEEIKQIREEQKKMIRTKTCVEIPENIAITNNSKYAAKILAGQANLMIKAFNIECDNLIGILKSSNYPSILERIDKVATDIEESALSLKCGFSKEYIKLKFKECELQYQFKLKQAREQEEQALIKENMREEQKAMREFERALAKAQKEEEMYNTALATARKELEVAAEKDKQNLEERIRLLEKELAEAEENKKRAQSMAEQTRRGHVYIISNIGSFGEDVYKIGLTRRLEPLERIKELGDASVPFEFDVHALIFSEDAPALERALHNEFNHHRVNQVNFRKEFFNVDLLQIQEKAKKLFDGEIDFKVTALAEEYYESLKLRENQNSENKINTTDRDA